jgi:hypothetical protein
MKTVNTFKDSTIIQENPEQLDGRDESRLVVGQTAE